jgi:hypothetical protein
VQQGATGNGSSWASAFGKLQKAINAASPGTQIWVSKGTYYPTQTILNNSSGPADRFNTFYIKKNIQLYGGFAGNETALNQRDWSLNKTVLSGDLDTLGKVGDNAYHVIYIDGTTSNGAISAQCIIDGFIVECGYADGAFPEDIAGALYINGEGSTHVASPTIRQTIFQHNYSRGWAGAVYCDGSEQGTCSPMIFNCLFWNNHANYGGAIYNFGYNGTCNPSIINCTFFNNWASSGGGAVRNFGPGNVGVFKNDIFWMNGDGIANVSNGTTTTINYSTIDDGNINGIVGLPSGASGSNNLDSFPGFIDTANGNLRLKNLSPAIDAGDNLANTLMIDLDSKPRKNGTIDMGAYENQFVNCPDTIMLSAEHQPFSGMYEAKNMIIVQHGIIETSASFYAPSILVNENVIMSLGTSVLLNQVGCN